MDDPEGNFFYIGQYLQESMVRGFVKYCTCTSPMSMILYKSVAVGAPVGDFELDCTCRSPRSVSKELSMTRVWSLWQFLPTTSRIPSYNMDLLEGREREGEGGETDNLFRGF